MWVSSCYLFECYDNILTKVRHSPITYVFEQMESAMVEYSEDAEEAFPSIEDNCHEDAGVLYDFIEAHYALLETAAGGSDVAGGK